MTLVFFCVSGLDLLDQLASIPCQRKAEIVEWIYGQQLGPGGGSGGWRGWGWESGDGASSSPEKEQGQLALSYAAVASLLILGDDLGRVDKAGLIAMISSCQAPDGSFRAHPDPSESDVRFVYCALALARLLGDWAPIHVPAALAFLRTCLVPSLPALLAFHGPHAALVENYDGAFGQRPGSESHGGSTYCVLAALALLDRLGPPFFSPAEMERFALSPSVVRGEGYDLPF